MKYLYLIFFLLFSGCSVKNFSSKESKIVVIKSPKLKFNDIGYIKDDGSYVRLELYSAGVAIESIDIKHLVCTKQGCITKSKFNKEYLHPSYPNDILRNILLKKPIFGGENLKKLSSGFIQNIKSKDYNIKYKVTPKEVFFKDRKNKIILKIKDIDG